MPLTSQTLRRLQKKTSQTMLGAQRRADMESNRLAQRLSELRAVEERRERARQREFRQAERQLSMAGLALSDSVIDVDQISAGRPRAVSSAEKRRALEQLSSDAVEGERRPRRRRQQRRPLSVFAPQAERQRQLIAEAAAEATEKTGAAVAAADSGSTAAGGMSRQQPHPASCCQYAGSDGAPCHRFPCCLPPSYSFISSKREMLQLYDLLLSQLPEHRRPHSGSDAAGSSDLGTMISDAEYLIEAQRRVSTLDPVERARLLRLAAEEWRRKHSGQLPQPRETRYGKPYPMRRILKPISCSTSFFLH